MIETGVGPAVEIGVVVVRSDGHVVAKDDAAAMDHAVAIGVVGHAAVIETGVLVVALITLNARPQPILLSA